MIEGVGILLTRMTAPPPAPVPMVDMPGPSPSSSKPPTESQLPAGGIPPPAPSGELPACCLPACLRGAATLERVSNSPVRAPACSRGACGRRRLVVLVWRVQEGGAGAKAQGPGRGPIRATAHAGVWLAVGRTTLPLNARGTPAAHSRILSGGVPCHAHAAHPSHLGCCPLCGTMPQCRFARIGAQAGPAMTRARYTQLLAGGAGQPSAMPQMTSVLEVPDAGGQQRHSILVAALDGVLVPHRPAGVHYCRNSSHACNLHRVIPAEREERVACQHGALQRHRARSVGK